MQGWPTVSDEIVGEVLFGRAVDVLLVDRRFKGGVYGVVLLVTVHHEGAGVIIAWERGGDGAGRGHWHVIRVIRATG